MCYCFVCDVKVSECKKWNEHYRASDKGPEKTYWKNQRAKAAGRPTVPAPYSPSAAARAASRQGGTALAMAQRIANVFGVQPPFHAAPPPFDAAPSAPLSAMPAISPQNTVMWNRMKVALRAFEMYEKGQHSLTASNIKMVKEAIYTAAARTTRAADNMHAGPWLNKPYTTASAYTNVRDYEVVQCKVSSEGNGQTDTLSK